MPSHIPRAEIELRWKRCRELVAETLPEAGGLLVFSRLNIYYLSGTFGSGPMWLPLDGQPVLLCRRGLERARLESSVKTILPFRSYADLPALLGEAGSPLSPGVAAEMNGLPWSLARTLTGKLPDCDFLPGDQVLARARAIKTEWELGILRTVGARHARCLQTLLPPLLATESTEEEIARKIWGVFFDQGHQGVLRMQGFGEEIFLGHVSAGESANYSSVLNGPVGVRGEHPAVPHMGSPLVRWGTEETLTVDVGFMSEGYHTDKTQVYWSGTRESIPGPVREAHDFCIEIQQWMSDRLKPGFLTSELAGEAFSRAAERGWAEGFMALGGNKVPFVGHGIGLTIDEYPPLAEKIECPLDNGMVLALEPKIGLPGVGMVGVENTFEVTPGGGKCLTGSDYEIICVPGG